MGIIPDPEPLFACESPAEFPGAGAAGGAAPDPPPLSSLFVLESNMGAEASPE